MGCSNVTLFVHDSRYISADFSSLRPDKILVDPPCSALGIMPKIYEYTSKSEIEALARYQKQFLEEAGKIVRPGGKVVYSVCTLTLQECEENALHADTTCNLSLEAQSPMLGSRAIPIQDRRTELCQRFHPHKNDAGFFIASFKKRIA
jgi:16S rRNA (cytosine967-C5)-methyltransferase